MMMQLMYLKTTYGYVIFLQDVFMTPLMEFLFQKKKPI